MLLAVTFGKLHIYIYIAERGYNLTKGNEYLVLIYMSAVITEEYNVMFNSEELIGTTEYLKLQARCYINQYHYNQIPLYY